VSPAPLNIAATPGGVGRNVKRLLLLLLAVAAPAQEAPQGPLAIEEFYSTQSDTLDGIEANLDDLEADGQSFPEWQALRAAIEEARPALEEALQAAIEMQAASDAIRDCDDRIRGAGGRGEDLSTLRAERGKLLKAKVEATAKWRQEWSEYQEKRYSWSDGAKKLKLEGSATASIWEQAGAVAKGTGKGVLKAGADIVTGLAGAAVETLRTLIDTGVYDWYLASGDMEGYRQYKPQSFAYQTTRNGRWGQVGDQAAKAGQELPAKVLQGTAQWWEDLSSGDPARMEGAAEKGSEAAVVAATVVVPVTKAALAARAAKAAEVADAALAAQEAEAAAARAAGIARAEQAAGLIANGRRLAQATPADRLFKPAGSLPQGTRDALAAFRDPASPYGKSAPGIARDLAGKGKGEIETYMGDRHGPAKFDILQGPDGPVGQQAWHLPEGTTVRIKDTIPSGGYVDMFRRGPAYSVSVRKADAAGRPLADSFENEAFKLNRAGDGVPKYGADIDGRLTAGLTDLERRAFEDEVMGLGHISTGR